MWGLWTLVVRAFPFLSSPVWGVAARVILWGGPSLAYLLLVRQRPLLLPLGLGFPYGPRQLIHVLVVPTVAGLILLVGTSGRMGLSVPELLGLLSDQARPRLVAPVFEELVFRGVLVSEAVTIVRETTSDLSRLRRRFWGVQLGCAAVFTLVHWPFWLRTTGLSATLQSSVPLVMTGLVLGVIFVSTRSIWVCIGLHWLNNELSLLQV
jgi:membrane protease YdiL (CAAX protease family)